MKRFELEWDDETVEHLAKHGVDPEEAEQACRRSPFVLRSRWGRYIALGQTEAGRYLTVIVEPIGSSRAKIITARTMTDQERQRYERR